MTRLTRVHTSALCSLLLSFTFDWLTAGWAKVQVSQQEHLILNIICCIHHVWGILVNGYHYFRVRGASCEWSTFLHQWHAPLLYSILLLSVFAGGSKGIHTCAVLFPAVCEHSQWAPETLRLWDAVPAGAGRVCAGGRPHGNSLLPLQSASCPGLLPSGTPLDWFRLAQSSLVLSRAWALMLRERPRSYQNDSKDLQLVQFCAASLSIIAEISSFHLQRPQGLLCLLDEESQSPRPAEQTLYKRLSAQLESSPGHGLSLTTKDGNGNPPPKDQGPAFTVNHYARQVRPL